MQRSEYPHLWPYVGRFTVVHILTYAAVSLLFLTFQSILPESRRIALALYEPFRPITFMTLTGQTLRGLAFAFVLYPFYPVILAGRRGKWILFGALWGLALVGSVEPQPGSIEGLIYTEISWLEHAAVLVAAAVEMLLFVWLFSLWETHLHAMDGVQGQAASPADPKRVRGYTVRFTLIHLITYVVIGGVFYQIAGYEDALESMEIFELWRPQDTMTAVFLVCFGQIFRAIWLALLLHPFYHTYIRRKHGWLLLFLLIFGLTALGSPLFLTEFISVDGPFAEWLQDLMVGIPEIAIQMLIFALVFFVWQRRVERRYSVTPTFTPQV